jgi:uncharacterized membrane protein YphA (DoxX/SURF4 family)
VLLGPFASVALLLVAAGLAKLRAPEATRTALAALGAPGPFARLLARSIGVVELGAGAWALAVGSRSVAVALVAIHLLFTSVTVALLRRPGVPCGCFGAQDAPASPAGVAANAVSAAVAALAVAWPPGGVASAFDDRLAGTLTFVLAALTAWLAYVAHGALPALGAVSPRQAAS